MTFEKNVFVNCPFDDPYLSLLRPLLFTVIYLGLKPRLALEVMDAGQARLGKIVHLIGDSKFGIHDLSRSEAVQVGELYRLNMPFELGIDFGCRLFGHGQQREKKTLVLEAEPYRYKASISDLSGADIEIHKNEPYRIIGIVRNWLKNVHLEDAVGASKISSAFSDFMAQNYDALTAKGFSSADIDSLPISELIDYMTRWVSASQGDVQT